MSAARSIKLCAGAFAGRQITPEQIAQIVRSRYPEAARLSERPELDNLLGEVGFQWREERGAYLRRGLEIESHTVPPVKRRATTHTPHRPTAGLELEEAVEFEERLRIAVERRDFRVLAVKGLELGEPHPCARCTHMLDEGILMRDRGRLALGPRGERLYGWRNFLDLYSVFTLADLLTDTTGARQVAAVFLE